MESWRVAAARWGDALFGIALLLTNQRQRAEHVTIAALMQVRTTNPTDDPERALYHAALHVRAHWRQPLRGRALPRKLARIAPIDRALLGLWLLRNINGERLQACAAQPPNAIVARLGAIIEARSTFSAPPSDDPACAGALERWLAHQLAFATAPDTHVRTCARCRAASGAWQAAADELRLDLRDALKAHRPPPDLIHSVEEALAVQQTPTAWWQRGVVWQSGIIAAVVLGFALLIAPGSATTGGRAQATLDPHGLVEQTLANWATPAITGTLHLQVQAIDELRDNNALLRTDVWLSGTDPAQHRIETHSGDQLVEWQIADGANTLEYAAEPQFSACAWNVRAPIVFGPEALAFRVSAAEQQAARDARVRQGALGTGYVALLRAHTAPDLRSFGTRRENGTSLVLLSYTDQTVTPARRIILRIAPEARQLHAVQAAPGGAAQAPARVLWQLQAAETSNARISLVRPRWASGEDRTQLLDPSCPALHVRYVVSLRAVAASRWWNWYFPDPLPDDDRGAVFLRNQEESFNGEGIANFVRPGRWLSIGAPRWESYTSASGDVRRDQWVVRFAEQQSPAITEATVFRGGTEAQETTVMLQVRAYGWTRDELLAMIDTLKPIDPTSWTRLNTQFLDAHPLDPYAQELLQRALYAITPRPNSAIQSTSQITVRGLEEPQRNDAPNFLRLSMLPPTSLTRQQVISYGATGDVRGFRDVLVQPDGTLYQATVADDRRFSNFSSTFGYATERAQNAVLSTRTPPQQPLDALGTLFTSHAPITTSRQGESWQLEQRIPPGDLSNLLSTWLFDGLGLPVETARSPLTLRVWLDLRSSIPRRLEVKTGQGSPSSALLFSMQITEYRHIPTPTSADLFNLPPFPPDVLVANGDSPDQWQINGQPVAARWADRTLVWPENVATRNANTIDPPPLTDLNALVSLKSSSEWSSLRASSAWHQSSYAVGPDRQRITVTQGSAGLLRHVLRFPGYWSSSRAPSNPISQRTTVMLAGQQREAWLLQDQTKAALIVEFDGRLIHFAGTPGFANGEPFLGRPLRDYLSEMVWLDGPNTLRDVRQILP